MCLSSLTFVWRTGRGPRPASRSGFFPSLSWCSISDGGVGARSAFPLLIEIGSDNMNEESKDVLREKIEALRTEHRDLDEILGRLSEDRLVDQLQLRRMKKRKLQLKDAIAKLESKLLPDMSA